MPDQRATRERRLDRTNRRPRPPIERHTHLFQSEPAPSPTTSPKGRTLVSAIVSPTVATKTWSSATTRATDHRGCPDLTRTTSPSPDLDRWPSTPQSTVNQGDCRRQRTVSRSGDQRPRAGSLHHGRAVGARAVKTKQHAASLRAGLDRPRGTDQTWGWVRRNLPATTTTGPSEADESTWRRPGARGAPKVVVNANLLHHSAIPLEFALTHD